MTESRLDLSRRQALGALASIGAGSAILGAGTYAAFSDTESSSGSLSTESITLDKGTQTISFQTANIEPGDSGSSSVVVQSTGTAGGRLDVSLSNVTNTDVESTSPEEEAEGGTNVPLADQLEVRMWVEAASPSDGSEGVFDPTYDYGLEADGTVAHGSGATLNYSDVSAYPTGTAYQTASIADSNPTDQEFYVEWQLPTSATNAVQRDQTTVDFALTLNQN